MSGLPDRPTVLEDVPVALAPDAVLRFQGYTRDKDVPSAEVLALFDEAVELGRRLMTPRAVVRWFAVTGSGPHTLATTVTTLTIQEIARDWGPVAHVAAAVCTIGEALEQEVGRRWEARELPLAMMLDSVGSAAVESLAEYVNDVLCQHGMPSGLQVTNRVSPGYAGWDVAEQALLFRMVPAALVGVTLNTACVMAPAKSISLLVGAGAHARGDHDSPPCARCRMRGCAYRRARARRAVCR